MEMHHNMAEPCRGAYKMNRWNGDCRIDMKFVIVTGEK